MSKFFIFCLCSFSIIGSCVLADQVFSPPSIKVASGFEVRLAASDPIVKYPMMACFDDFGHLYVAESDGRNLTTRAAIERELPRFVRRLVDVDGDGVFDKSTIFADRMTMPEGGVWYNGALYIISAPYLWRLEDIDGDGVADKRDKILGTMEFDGRANQHGPYLGPNGRMYFSGGHFGYDLIGTDGTRSGFSRAAGIFSCWPDGTDVQVEGQGGVNPVDIVFTSNGDMLSTCAIFDSFGGKRHDALIHWMPGGLTQRVYGSPLLPETGFRLPATSRWGQVAPAGLIRYRGKIFGEAYQDTLFACHFNTRKVVNVRLESNNGSFVTVEKDFLSSDNIGFHPADILEDADGSLLLLDTGGWLSWGCPFSKKARPEIKGAIYRIQRKGVLGQQDPRGLRVLWDSINSKDLVYLLNDPRPAVRDKAIEVIITRDETILDVLSSLIIDSDDPVFRKRCLWAVSRFKSERSLVILRKALNDPDSGVRQVAARSLGRLKDLKALLPLSELLSDSSPPVRAASATAIGQLGDKNALSFLFNNLNPNDPIHTKHAFVYAIARIGDSTAVSSYLSDNISSFRQQIALRVLASIGGDLDSRRVIPLLRSPDSNVCQEARRLISSRKEMKGEIINIFHDIIKEEKIRTPDDELIEGIILAFAQDNRFQEILLDALSSKVIKPKIKVQILASLSFLDTLPDSLQSSIIIGLNHLEADVRMESLNIAQRFDVKENVLDAILILTQNSNNSQVERTSAIQVLAKHQGYLRSESFSFLVSLLGDKQTQMITGRQAAKALGLLRIHLLNERQLDALFQIISEANSFYLPALTRQFTQGREMNESNDAFINDQNWNLLGNKLSVVLNKSPGFSTLGAGQRQKILQAFSNLNGNKVHKSLSDVMKNNFHGQKKQETEIDPLVRMLNLGNASRGRVLFHEERVSCGVCHRIGDRGGKLGPNLSKIGGIRQPRDLLEAILYPSSTIVNGYEYYVVESTDGKSSGGIIHRENSSAIYLKNADVQDVRVPRDKIHSIKNMPVSIMPTGFGQILSKQELLDLVAFLQVCK